MIVAIEREAALALESKIATRQVPGKDETATVILADPSLGMQKL